MPDPIRFAILGHGKIARTRFLPAIADTDAAKLVLVASGRDADTVKPDLSGLRPAPTVVPYQAIFGEWADDLDAVYIALPNHLHLAWATRAAAAGLHILCEKPLASDHQAALALRRHCAANGVLLAEAFMYRHDPRHQRVREQLAAGRIGQPSLIEAHFSYFLEDLDNIRLRADCLGGALMDIGCYGIDLSRFLFDEEPLEVTARAVLGERSGVDELTSVNLLFPGGRMATVTASTHLERRHGYRVSGSFGHIEVPDAFVPDSTRERRIEIYDGTGIPERETFPPFDPYHTQLDRFCEAIRTGAGHLPPPVEDGVANARALEAATCSLHEGKRVELTWQANGVM